MKNRKIVENTWIEITTVKYGVTHECARKNVIRQEQTLSERLSNEHEYQEYSFLDFSSKN